MRTLITGANGYIGSHLANRLTESGHEVNGLILRGTDISCLKGNDIKLFYGDVRDTRTLYAPLQGVQTVYHLASLVSIWQRDPEQFYEINAKGTRNLLEACLKEGVHRVLICSSCGIFGPSEKGQPIDESIDNFAGLTDPYEISKYHQVRIGKYYMRKGLEVVFVFPTRVFGPGIKSDGNSLTSILTGAVNGSWRLILGSGRNIANYIFVDDVIRGLELVMGTGRSGEGYILGGYNLTYDQLFEKLQDIAGKRIKLYKIPYPLLHLVGSWSEFRAGWTGKKPFITRHAAKKYTSDWFVSTKKIRHELGFVPTSLDFALQQTLYGKGFQKTRERADLILAD